MDAGQVRQRSSRKNIHIIIKESGQINWASRKDSKEKSEESLLAELSRFIEVGSDKMAGINKVSVR